MSPEEFAIIIGAFTGGGGVVALLQYLASRRTARADVAFRLTDTASKIVGDLRVELDRLQGKVLALEQLLQEQDGTIEAMRVELKTAARRILDLERENAELRRIMYE